MLRRTPIRRKAPPPRPVKTITYTPRAREVARPDGKARMSVPVPMPKEAPIQHEGYMAAVRTLACARCGIVGFTQFCHADEGKGMGLKTDCRYGWPGCGPHGADPGCHWYVGTSGRMGKEARRAFEASAAAHTRADIRRRGLWPRSLPQLPEDAQ